MSSFKATDDVTSKPSWLTSAQKINCHGADASETGPSGLVMHQGWTVPAGGTDNVLAQRETIACVNMTSDIGGDDDTAFGLAEPGPAYIEYNGLTSFGGTLPTIHVSGGTYTTQNIDLQIWNNMMAGQWEIRAGDCMAPSTWGGADHLPPSTIGNAGTGVWSFLDPNTHLGAGAGTAFTIEIDRTPQYPTALIRLPCVADNWGENQWYTAGADPRWYTSSMYFQPETGYQSMVDGAMQDWENYPYGQQSWTFKVLDNTYLGPWGEIA